ncbi:hypothetical protein E2C01_048223 [Portunus trituberculatus]|uniref:Uncharacterized protein n=1 Tax=Portunus trituberculatus TaxID=210409 RepID=A0A5B7GAK9_PORTR|nr:hypothetical protein [Portunus trituberculatus]
MHAWPVTHQFAVGSRLVHTFTLLYTVCCRLLRGVALTKKRQKRENDVPRGEVKKRKEDAGSTPQQHDDDVPPTAAAGPSGHNVNSGTGDTNYDRLSCLLGSLIEKLDKKANATTSRSSYTGLHDLSPSGGEDGKISECLPDPLDDLDSLCSPLLSGADPEEEVFTQAL